MAKLARREDAAIVQNHRMIATFAWLTIVGIVIYVALVAIAQLLPPHYSAIRDAESDLAVGKYGYVMTIAFVVRGILSASLLVALERVLPPLARSRWGLNLLGVWAVGAFLLAVFETDLDSKHHTLHGGIHLIVALIAFISVALAEVLLSRQFRATTWPEASKTALRLLSYLTALALIVFFVTFGLHGVFGLFERIFLGSALLWMLVVAVQLIATATPKRDAREPE